VSGRGAVLPVLAVVAGILLLWYVLAVALNAPWARDQASRDGVTLGPAALVAATMRQERPRLPAPHQVAAELWKSTMGVSPTSRGASSITPG
jgi:NitT/TauT family transport system permease protein